MKIKYFSAIGILALTFATSSCNDILDKETNSYVTEKGLGLYSANDSARYTTAIQMESIMGAAYGDFSSGFWQLDWYVTNDCQSDNSYGGEPKEQTLQFDEFRLMPTNESVARDWEDMYKQIAKTNTIIQWTDQVPDPALTNSRKKELIGEASTLRALCYFNLVRLYGDVPLVVIETPSISNANLPNIYHLLFPPRVGKDTVYNQIIKDLEIGIKYAPDYSHNKFRATKSLANLLLAQVYATKDGFAGTKWEKVKEYSQNVVNNPNYSLLPNYDDLFAAPIPPSSGILPKIDLSNENSKESLFEINFTGDGGLGNWGANMFFGYDWKKFNTPSHDLVRAFDLAQDEVRKNASITFDDVTGKWADRHWPSNKYPFCFKQRAQEKGNVILFRLPEAILLLAEAENELGNISQAQTLLNKVRTRVNLPNTTANTKDALRLAIENEHRLEFAFEGKRWMDLVRRGRFIEVMKSASDYQREFARANLNENRLIWPIPQVEREKNSKLTQNPGY